MRYYWYVCTVPYDDSESESQGSTACPDDSWPDVTDETDTASLLQFLDGPLGHNDGKYGWFGGFPCPCDRWCSSQNNHAVAHSKDEGPIHDMQHRKWKWIQECRSEAELAQPDWHFNLNFQDEENDDGAESLGEESLLIVSFGIKDDDKGRKDGQLHDFTLQGLRQMIWSLWQDEVDQFGLLQVFEPTPQPLQELGLQQALVLIVTLDGMRRDGDVLLQPTLNMVVYENEAIARVPHMSFLR